MVTGAVVVQGRSLTVGEEPNQWAKSFVREESQWSSFNGGGGSQCRGKFTAEEEPHNGRNLSGGA